METKPKKKGSVKKEKKVEIVTPPEELYETIEDSFKPKKTKSPLIPLPKPLTLNQPLSHSSLPRAWHHYLQFKHRCVLSGSFSQSHKRFRPSTNGLQGACISIVACILHDLSKVEYWNCNMINDILIAGDNLCAKSLANLSDKSTKFISVPQVHTTFFFDIYKINFKVIHPNDPFRLTINGDNDQCDNLHYALSDFFSENTCGVARINQRHIALWSLRKRYYLFDPTEHLINGERWTGLIGGGFAVCVKFSRMHHLVDFIVTVIVKGKPFKLRIWPIKLLVYEKVPFDTPLTLAQVKTLKLTDKHKRKPCRPPQDELTTTRSEQFPIEYERRLKKAAEMSPEVTQSYDTLFEWKSSGKRSRNPAEARQLNTVSFYTTIKGRNVTIIRGSTHQTDKKFSRFRDGEQSLSQAVAPFVMRRSTACRQWNRKFVNDILKLGEIIQHESLKVNPDGIFKLSHILKKIVYLSKSYMLDFDEYALFGRLGAGNKDVLNLYMALTSFLREHDSCIINGPNIISVWNEDNKYYMYDPNERNECGKVMDPKRPSSKGVACVTCFDSLKELVILYTKNVPKEKQFEEFHLSRICVVDFVPTAADWNNFKGFGPDRWILRGTTSQRCHVFPEDEKHCQCVTNAGMSIAFAQIVNPEDWTKKLIDQVILAGNELYVNLLTRLAVEECIFTGKSFRGDEIDRMFTIGKKHFIFEVDDCFINGRSEIHNGHLPGLELKTGLSKFFDEYEFGIVSYQHMSVAIWKIDDAYYIFDSHSRDEKGYHSTYGVACVLRVLDTTQLAKLMENNYFMQNMKTYEIAALNVIITDVVEKEDDREPLYNYTQNPDNEDIAILLANSSSKDPKYDISAGKQTVAMCVTAFGMNRIRPSARWNHEILQTILDIGNKYYQDSMTFGNGVDPPIPEPVRKLNADELKKKFRLGMNNIELETELVAEGVVGEGLEQAINNYYTTNTEITDEDKLELIVNTEDITVGIWKDARLFYVFDPYPRDDNGQAIGKDTWGTSGEEKPPTDEDQGAPKPEPAPAPAPAPVPATAPEEGAGDQGDQQQEPKVEEIPVDAEASVDIDLEGKACILFFYKLEDVVKHIIENIRPDQKSTMIFNVSKARVQNTPIMKNIYSKEYGLRKDDYSGDWYDFTELDHGHWILRGQINMDSDIFLEGNKNSQDYASVFVALAYANLFPMHKMKPQHITSILCYGDRLVTFMKRIRREQLSNDTSLNLLANEIEAIVNNEKYEIDHFPTSFAIDDYLVYFIIIKNFLTGDVQGSVTRASFDLRCGINEFFKRAEFGILECKGYVVALWRGTSVYYMYDPHKTGVSGLKSPVGYPAITRSMKTNRLADIYRDNLPDGGNTSFQIHRIFMDDDHYKRAQDELEKVGTAKPVKISGFKELNQGKLILCGSCSQEDPRYGKGERILCSPVAFCALTMSLIHKPYTWSKPIVDEVLSNAYDLYVQTLVELGSTFNPWESVLDPYMVSKDFRIGNMHATCQLRSSDQSGMLNVRDLRQALEHFFNENSHAILYSPPNICYAIWDEEKDGVEILYMYDPNKRGPTGLPDQAGVACVLACASPKVVAEHILSCIENEEEKQQEFILLPVEVTVGPFDTTGEETETTKPISNAQQKISRLLSRQSSREEREKKKVIDHRDKKEMKKQYWESRIGYSEVTKGEAILRGTHCLTSSCYPEKSRGLQDIPVCVVSFVANCIIPVSKWTYKELDSVLDTGDQLYKDSYLVYNPRDKRLGLQNIIRNIYVMNKKAHVSIFKPIMLRGFNTTALSNNFEKWFLDENFCMLNRGSEWVSVFFKTGFYYLLQPHSCNSLGIREHDGASCILKYDKLEDLAARVILNMPAEGDDYYFVMVRLDEDDSFHVC